MTDVMDNAADNFGIHDATEVVGSELPVAPGADSGELPDVPPIRYRRHR